MSTYRVTIKYWDRHYGDGHVQFSRKFEARKSKKADQHAIDLLEEGLRLHPKPQGRIAEAWAERSDNYGPRTLRAYDGSSGSWVRVDPMRPIEARETETMIDYEDEPRDERWVIMDDYDILQLMRGWTEGERDPLYAIASMGGENYAWVFEDAIANIDSDLRKVKKVGKKYQLGKGTFTKAEIDELHEIRDALQRALDYAEEGLHEAPSRRAPHGRRPIIDEKLYAVTWAGGRRGNMSAAEVVTFVRDLRQQWRESGRTDPMRIQVWYRDGSPVPYADLERRVLGSSHPGRMPREPSEIRYPDPPRGPRGPFVAPRSRARARRSFR
jgi:hypothetical protein